MGIGSRRRGGRFGLSCVCNNPMTKEAKLTAAVRILPEWKSYDDEIRELQKKIDSGVLDADPAESLDTNEREATDLHSEL
ncbi:hypothetical protein NQ318_020129 [Aromia moschata]|uniref:Glucosyltransferase 24 catalytic domain-containing protein n=1 Tax=Aromia moschata TaxID=1265417 RepID=A0AAV8ZAM6_9CUCU|nr:hypothetical protein NQ318_020129 [Aromia moschata]